MAEASNVQPNNQAESADQAVEVCRNVGVNTSVLRTTRQISCKPKQREFGTQTPAGSTLTGIVPVPYECRFPLPIVMDTASVPLMMPFLLPVPFPVYLPVTAQGFVEFADRVHLMEQSIKISELRNGKSRLINTTKAPTTNNTDQAPYVPDDPEFNLTLGAKLFRDFVHKLHEEQPRNVPKSFLEFTTTQLATNLLEFMTKLNRVDGSPCAPEMLYFVFVGLQYFLGISGRVEDIFHDHEFKLVSQLIYDRLQHCTIYIDPRDNCVHSRLSEEVMWRANFLGSHSPQTLLNTVFYLNIKCFLVRNVSDHFDLTFANVRQHLKHLVVEDEPPESDDELFSAEPKYTEVGRQNFVRYYPSRDPSLIYEQVENREKSDHCACKILEFYISKCPPALRYSNQCIYLEPEKGCCAESKTWFTSNTVSEHTMTKMILQTRMIKEVSELELAFASNPNAIDPTAVNGGAAPQHPQQYGLHNPSVSR